MKSIKQPEYVMEKTSFSKLNETCFTTSGSLDSDQEEYVDECDFPFTNFDSRIQVNLVDSTPQTKHLIVGRGVNIKARCANNNCTANTFQSKECWIKKGIGHFDIAKERYKSFCVCGTRVAADSIKTIGFTRASIKVTGLKIVNDEAIDFQQTYIEDKGKFIYFNDIDSTMSMWASLHIEAKEL